MRNTILWNEGWLFEKAGVTENVSIPHTWNAQDGQTGPEGMLAAVSPGWSAGPVRATLPRPAPAHSQQEPS